MKKRDDSSIHYGIYARYIKRTLDIIVSSIMLIVLSPAFLMLCILIRIKLGSPIFFKQIRAGRNEKPFEMIKFRTMTDARDKNGELLSDQERFTKFGDFLRNYSLDELPELINVLKGDMSIIGPRPLYTFYLPFYTEEESIRHAVRGGITGLAQVNGRALCRWKDRFSYDVQYVKNISFWEDIRILLETVYKVFKKADIGIPSVTDEGGLHIIRDVQRPEKIGEIGSSFSAMITGEVSGSYPVHLANPLEKEHVVYLSSGRSCIREVLSNINPVVKRAIVPSFTCESVIEPFIDAGYELDAYSLNADFSIDIDALKEKLECWHPSVLLFHRYFGYDTCSGIENVLAKYPDLISIEDETQYMFSNSRFNVATFRLGSIRKWGPFPDGAYLVSRGLLLEQPVKEDKEFVNIEREAMTAKQNFLDGKTLDTGYKSLFAEGRKHIDNEKHTYAMSSVSNYMVERFSAQIASKHRANASVLIEGLQNYDWFSVPMKSVPDNVTPFMVPLFVHRNRKEFQQYLASQKIYATIIWGCPEMLQMKINQKDRLIYDEILCLPCDQRYDIADMQRIIFAIRRFDEKRGML